MPSAIKGVSGEHNVYQFRSNRAKWNTVVIMGEGILKRLLFSKSNTLSLYQLKAKPLASIGHALREPLHVRRRAAVAWLSSFSCLR